MVQSRRSRLTLLGRLLGLLSAAGGYRRLAKNLRLAERRRRATAMVMLAALPDTATLAFLLLGALAAGFVTGFAGFGTGLVASGFWFHVLPAALVPPMVVIASVTAQLISLAGLRPKFDWPRAAPFLIGGALGVPLGRSEEHTSELQSLMRISYAVFCLKKKI